jgi:head-tail adaptor
MKAGNLDRRISILRQGAAVDDGYTVVPGALGVLANRAAAWRPATRTEQFESAGEEAKVGGSFWLRSDSITRQVVETDKIAYSGRIYEILGIREIGRREGLEVIVESGDDPTDIDLSGLSPIPDARVSYTGWAAYNHTGAAQSVVANVKAPLVNNAGSKIEDQKPADVADLYDGTAVTGRVGDAIMVAIELTFTPSDGDTSSLALDIDIGGTVGEIYTEEFPITRGANVPHKISYHPPAYTLDTWAANGGMVEVMADGAGSISNVRYVIHRLHKAR